jgi:ssDNA-binding replication factor A large subunit
MLRSRALAQDWWEEQGQKGVWGEGFNANAYRLQVCNRFPQEWRDRPETHVTVNNEVTVDTGKQPEEWSQAEIEAELKRREELPQPVRVKVIPK